MLLMWLVGYAKWSKVVFFLIDYNTRKSIHEIQMCGLVLVLRDAASIMCRLLEKNKTEQPIVVVRPMTEIYFLFNNVGDRIFYMMYVCVFTRVTNITIFYSYCFAVISTLSFYGLIAFMV